MWLSDFVANNPLRIDKDAYELHWASVAEQYPTEDLQKQVSEQKHVALAFFGA